MPYSETNPAHQAPVFAVSAWQQGNDLNENDDDCMGLPWYPTRWSPDPSRFMDHEVRFDKSLEDMVKSPLFDG